MNKKRETMKVYINLLILGILISAGLCSGMGNVASYLRENKAPLKITGLFGAMPQEYAVYLTTIMIKKEDYQPGQLGPSPIISRVKLGTVSAQKTAAVFDADLKTPNVPVNFEDAAYKIPDMAAKIAGACNPKAGVIVGAVSALSEIGMQIASDSLNHIFRINETTLTFIDIFPTKYYNVNVETNEIEIKPAFKQELENYVATMKDVMPLAVKYKELQKKYNDAVINYKRDFGLERVEVLEGNEAAQQPRYDAIKAILDDKNKAAADMVVYLEKLRKTGLHRITIMALNNSQRGDICGSGWKGPWRLYAYFFLGSKLTSLSNVDFCIKDQLKLQQVQIHLTPNNFIKIPKFDFKPGGIRFVGVDEKGTPCKPNQCSIAFPTTGVKQVAYPTSSELYDWYDSSIMSGEDYGKGLTQFLLPYDINAMEKEVIATRAARSKEIGDKALASLETAIELFKGDSESSRELIDPDIDESPLKTKTKKTISSIDDLLKTFKKKKSAKEVELEPETEAEEGELGLTAEPVVSLEVQKTTKKKTVETDPLAKKKASNKSGKKLRTVKLTLTRE